MPVPWGQADFQNVSSRLKYFSNDLSPYLYYTEMDYTDIKCKVLEAVFPGECSIVGKTNTQNIASGSTELIKTYGGSNVDMSVIISGLIGAVTFLDSVINIYQFVLNRPTNDSVSTPANTIIINQTINIQSSTLTENEKSELVNCLLNQINKINNIQ